MSWKHSCLGGTLPNDRLLHGYSDATHLLVSQALSKVTPCAHLCVKITQFVFMAHLRVIFPCRTIASSVSLISLQTYRLAHTVTALCMERVQKTVVMNKCNGQRSQEWVFSRHYTPHRRTKPWFKYLVCLLVRIQAIIYAINYYISIYIYNYVLYIIHCMFISDLPAWMISCLQRSRDQKLVAIMAYRNLRAA